MKKMILVMSFMVASQAFAQTQVLEAVGSGVRTVSAQASKQAIAQEIKSLERVIMGKVRGPQGPATIQMAQTALGISHLAALAPNSAAFMKAFTQAMVDATPSMRQETGVAFGIQWRFATANDTNLVAAATTAAAKPAVVRDARTLGTVSDIVGAFEGEADNLRKAGQIDKAREMDAIAIEVSETARRVPHTLNISGFKRSCMNGKTVTWKNPALANLGRVLGSFHRATSDTPEAYMNVAISALQLGFKEAGAVISAEQARKNLCTGFDSCGLASKAVYQGQCNLQAAN